MKEFINGDCMEGMKGYPDNFFDLAIVDPPYGLKRLEKGEGWLEKYGDTGKWNHLKPSQEYWDELFRVSKNQIVWGANNFNMPTSEYFLIWDKKQMYPNMARCEYAWVSMGLKKPAKIFELRFGSEKNRIHPTQKPEQLYKWILMNYTKETDCKILDTHVGSGSSLIAFEDFGCEYVGYEIDPDYYSDALKRLNQHKAQLTMQFSQ